MKLFRPTLFISGSRRNATAANLICGGDETVRSACGPKTGGFFSRARVMFLIIGILFISLNVSAQENVQFHWPLTSTAEVALPSPYASLSFNVGRSVDSLRFTEDFGAMAGRWNSENLDPEAYYEYTLSPAPGIRLVVNQINLEVSVSRVNMRTSVQYSYDGFTRQKTQLGHTYYIATQEPRNLPVKTSLSVTYPQALSIRVYGWSTVDYLVDFCTRNVSLDAQVFGRDLLAENQGDTLSLQPQLPEIEPVTPETLAALPETEVSLELSQADTAIMDEALAAMNVLPEDILGGSERGGDRGVMGNIVIPSSTTWTVPAGISQITVECWGGGGGGGGARIGAGGGGGGGAYNTATFAVSVGQVYTITVGNGGASGSNQNGGNGGTTTVTGPGGNVTTNGGNGGARGNGSRYYDWGWVYVNDYGDGGNGGIGAFNGGNGGNSSGNGAGGGGGAGNNGNRTSGSNTGNGIGGAGNPNIVPYIGGNGGGRRNANNNGISGNIPGGGGGGARSVSDNTSRPGGAGARGQVIISWPDCINPIITSQPIASTICADQNTSFTVTATGTALTYHWQVNTGTGWNNIANGGVYSNAASATLSLTNVPGTYNGYQYRCVVSSEGCNTTSNQVNLTVHAPTATITGTTSVCLNAPQPNITFTGANGTPPYTFTYRINGGANQTITTTSGNSVTLAVPTNTANTYVYSLVSVRDANNCTQPATGNATVIVRPLPTANISVNPTSVCQNGTSPIVTFTGDNGTAPYTFSYRIGTGTDQTITTTSGNSVTLAVPTNTDGTFIYTLLSVQDANGCSQSQSGSVQVIVHPLPVASITGPTPACQGVPGQVYSTQTGMSNYNWSITGGTITAGGLTASVTVTWNTIGTQSISVYHTDDNGCTSNQVIYPVTVNSRPTATISGTAEICTGENATITINFTGTAPFTFQVNGGAAVTTSNNPYAYQVSPGTTTTYVVTSLSDAYCSAIASDLTGTATITVNWVDGGVIAEDQHICFREQPVTITSTIDGDGEGSITYRWQRASDPFTAWSTISGATNATYLPLPNQTITYKYRRITISTLPSGKACEAISNEVLITVQGLVTAGEIEEDQTICSGDFPDDITSVLPGTSGTGTITYEWQQSINGGTTWQPLSGISHNYTFTNPVTTTTLIRRRTLATVNGNPSCYSEYTAPVTITVIPPPTPGIIGGTQTICYNTIPSTLTSIQNGASPGSQISYKWEYSTDNGTTWNEIIGAVGSSYTPTAPLIVTTWYHRITLATKNGKTCPSLPTDPPIIVTVQQEVNPGSIAEDQTICYNDTPAPITSTQPGSGSATPTYSWQFSTDNGITWFTIFGATGAGYSPGKLIQNTLYRRITTITLYGKACTAISEPVSIEVLPEVIAPIDLAADQEICYNTRPAQMSYTPTVSFSYQWQSSTDNINFSNVNGQTGTTYRPGNLTVTTYYRIKTVLGTCEAKYSNTVQIIVWPQFVTPVICCDVFSCIFNQPPPLTITTPASGYGSNVTYQWQRSYWYLDTSGWPWNWKWSPWSNINGATSEAYTPPVENVTRYRYRLIVTDSGCTGSSLASNAVEITPAISLSGNLTQSITPDRDFCPEEQFTYHIESGSIGGLVRRTIRYEWEADPEFITPASGGPQYSQNGIFGFYTDIIFTTHNNTVEQVNTTITVYPKVYNSNGSIACELEAETVVITINPFIMNCPADIISATTDEGECHATIEPEVPTADCGYSSLSWETEGATELSGNGVVGEQIFNKGLTIVTYTAINSAGTETTCSFFVNVTDDEDPVIICPDVIERTTDLDLCTAYIEYELPIVTDNCGSYILEQTAGLTSGSYFNVGTTTNTFVATDASGNSSECSFTVTVNDDQPPAFTYCPSNITSASGIDSCSKSFTPPHPDIFENCEEDFYLVWEMTFDGTTTSGSGFLPKTEFEVGTTTITYTLKGADNNDLDECTFTVTITDNQDPFLTVPDENLALGCNPELPTEASAIAASSAIDNCGIPTITAEEGEIIGDCEKTQTFIVIATDGSGNTDIKTITYTWSDDDVAPAITCPSGSPFTVNVTTGNTYIHPDNSWDATATDNCPGTVTLAAQLSGVTTTGPHTTLNGVTFNQGLTTVTWTATDACGNEATCSFEVQVDGEADISVVKTVSPVGAITAGQNITYTLVVTNNGPAVAPEVTLLDNMPAQVVGPTSWTLNGVVQAGTWPESWVFNNMAVGASGQQTVVITGKVDCDIANMFANTATVLLSPPFIDPNTGNNNSTVTNSIVDPVAVSGIVTDGDCESNGAIDITVTGGTTPYTYAWTGPAGFTSTDEDLTGLVSGTYTVLVTDANGCEATGSWTVTSEDTEPPTFELPQPPSFCVNNIFSAVWDGQTLPEPDIFPDPLFEAPYPSDWRRPDWYILDGTPELDILDVADNCCLDEDAITWVIQFAGIDPNQPDISGTGQPSANGPIILWGTPLNQDVIHTIIYTLTDCSGNSFEQTMDFTIKPRPNVIKQY